MKNVVITYGAKVYWNDPEGLTSDYYRIKEIDLLNNTCLLFNDYSETQAHFRELSNVPI